MEFSLTLDNLIVAIGKLWRHTGAIPMGGSFSTYAAELHSVWCCKILQSLGQFDTTAGGVLQWTKGAPQAQCARSATIWASGRTRDPYFEILGAPRGIMVTRSGHFEF